MADGQIQDSNVHEAPDPKDGVGKLDLSNLEQGSNVSLVSISQESEKVKPIGRRAAEEDTVLGATKEAGYSAVFTLNATAKGITQFADKTLGTELRQSIPDMDLPAEADFGSLRWYGQNIGGAAAIAGPFMLTHAGVRRVGKTIARTNFGQVAASSRFLNAPWKAAALEGGIAGGLFEFVGREVPDDQNFLINRSKNFGVGLATFGPMTATSVGLSSYARTLSNPLAARVLGNEISTAAFSGLPAGLTHTVADSYLHDKPLTGEDLYKNVVTFVSVGAGLGLKDFGKRQLGFENKTFYDHAVEARENAILNKSLVERMSEVEAAKTGEVRPEVKTADSQVVEKPGALKAFRDSVIGRGRERVLGRERVMAEGEKGYIELEIPPSMTESFNRGRELATAAAKDYNPKSEGLSKSELALAEHLRDMNAHGAEGKKAVRALYELAHLFSDRPMIGMYDRIFGHSEVNSGIMRGEILAAHAAKENPTQMVTDAFTQYANGEGVHMGHWLLRFGRQAESPAIEKLVVDTYRNVEASELAKDMRFESGVKAIKDRQVEAYEPQSGEAQTVRVASDVAVSRLRNQLDPTASKSAETFNYEVATDRLAEFHRGIEMLTGAKRAGTEVDSAEFSNFAKGEGAKVGQALLEWAHIVDNPSMVKQIEAAYGFSKNDSGVIKGEALAQAASQTEAPQSLRERFQNYSRDEGLSLGEYLLNRAAELNDRNMEFWVATTYGSNLDSPLGAKMNKGLQLVDIASGNRSSTLEGGAKELPAKEFGDLVDFATGEGQHLGRALEYGALLSGDSHALTVVREAYLFAQGRTQLNMGDAKIQIPELLGTRVEQGPNVTGEMMGQVLDLIKDASPDASIRFRDFKARAIEAQMTDPNMKFEPSAEPTAQLTAEKVAPLRDLLKDGVPRTDAEIAAFREKVMEFAKENPELFHDGTTTIKTPFPEESVRGFLGLVSANLPTNAAEYAQFRAMVIDYLGRHPEFSAKINNDLSPNNGRTVGEIVASQTQHSVIAGPIDFYFKSHYGLSRFPETAASVRDYNRINTGAEVSSRSPQYETTRRFERFENAQNELAKQVEASTLVERFSSMTPEQFRQWLEFSLANSQSGTGITNLQEMGIAKSDVLRRPEVADQLNKGADGEAVLEQYRHLLSESPTPAEAPLPGWMNRHISRRILMAKSRLGESASPLDLLADALPKWALNKVGEKVTFDAEGKPVYEKQTNFESDLVGLIDHAALVDKAGLRKLLHDRQGNRDQRRVEPDNLANRLDTVDNLLNIKDSGLVESLRTLGSDNPQVLRQVLQKMNPEKSAPEWAELIKLSSAKAESITEIGLLMDTIFVGNKAHQAGRPSKYNENPSDTSAEVSASQQLAKEAVNNLVDPADLTRAYELVEGLIDGTYRDPSPKRFGSGSQQGGGPRGGGRQGGRGQGRGQGRP